MTDRELMLEVRKLIAEGSLRLAAVALDNRLQQLDWDQPYEPDYWPETELERLAA